MIEFLSNNSWITPQIDFLVFLQGLRISHFEMFNKFFLSVTVLGEFWLPTMIPAIIYWCIDSKKGMYLFSIFGINFLFAQFFKMIACVYRPWILSDRVTPLKEAFTYALGYSFPSGHSATSSSIFGGLAFILRKNVPVAIMLVLLAFLVGFSRMWLGVHTPQDVIVGLTIGFALVFIMDYIINWAEKNKNRYLYLLLIINLVSLAAILYNCYFNIYPCDYVDNKLLVNPWRSLYAFIACYGYALGMINGCFLIRRFFPFDASKGTLKTKIIRGIVGILLTIAILKLGLAKVFAASLDYKVEFIITGLAGFTITGIYPLIFTKIENK